MSHYVRTFFAGAGLLLFGLSCFEQAIKTIGGRNLKRFMQKHISSTWRGLWAGVGISGVTTSSTFVSLILVAFVGSGLLALPNALSVIIGANIGTTLNGLLVAYLGFGGFSLKTIAMPLIAVGGGILVVNRTPLWKEIARMIIGIGLLFVGLGYMKDSIELIAVGVDLSQFSSPWIIGIVALILTGLLHSQATMQLLLLSSLSSGIIGVEGAFAGIIGANIGTTATALTAAMGGSKAHKQIALAHFFQNLISGIVGVVLFDWFLRLCTDWLANILGYGSNVVFATAWFNATFNILTGIPFLFFIQPSSKFLLRITNASQETNHLYVEKFRSIGQTKQTIGIQWYAAKHDVQEITKELFVYLYAIFKTIPDELNGPTYAQNITTEWYDQQYHTIKDHLESVYSFLYKIQELPLEQYDVERVYELLMSCNHITHTAKLLRSIQSNCDDLSRSPNEILLNFWKQIQENVRESVSGESLGLQSISDIFDQTLEYLKDHDGVIDIPTLITTKAAIINTLNNLEQLKEYI